MPSLEGLAIAEHPLRCPFCSGGLFSQRRVMINTRAAELFDLA